MRSMALWAHGGAVIMRTQVLLTGTHEKAGLRKPRRPLWVRCRNVAGIGDAV
jgi:hypothetical protein